MCIRDSFQAVSSVVNISDGDIGIDFDAEAGTEVNISGGTVGAFFRAARNSVVNISGGDIGVQFLAASGSEVNISGGNIGFVNINGDNIGAAFVAAGTSEINLFGSNFVLDGVPLDSLNTGDTLTIVDRDVILSGLLADGSPFSFDLDSTDTGLSFFSSNATLTVTLGAPAGNVLLGDADQDGVVDFSDIPAFIAVLQAGTFLAEADCNQNGQVDFADIPVFIAILQGS